MRTLSIPTGKLLVIPGETLPEDAENIRVIQITGPAVLYYEFGNSKWTTITIPPGSWSLFGKASELTDEQMKHLLYFMPDREGDQYLDYTKDNSAGRSMFCLSLSESYASFLTFHGIKPEDVLLIEN